MVICPECKGYDYYSNRYGGRTCYYCTDCGTGWYYETTTTSTTTQTINFEKSGFASSKTMWIK
jgi:transposase-like protein